MIFQISKNRTNYFIIISILVFALISLWYTNSLISSLSKDEENLIGSCFEATKTSYDQSMRSRNTRYIVKEEKDADKSLDKTTKGIADTVNFDPDLLSGIKLTTTSIPVIWTDDKFKIISFCNIDSVKCKNSIYLNKQLNIMKHEHKPYAIFLRDKFNYLLYKDSPFLEKLRNFLYIQISIIVIFLFITFLSFNNSLSAALEKEKYMNSQNILLENKVQTRTKQLVEEKEHSDSLLLNILPSEVAEELKSTGSAKAKSFDMVTVMITDFKNFTQTSENMNAKELVEELNFCYSEFDKIITDFNIEKIKTIGDSYMAVSGLPAIKDTHASDTVRAAAEIQKFMHEYKIQRQKAGQPFFEMRIGINSGPVIAGIVGVKKFAYDIWGDTVNIASLMESNSETGKINISGTTYALVKENFVCTYRGKVEAKHKGMIDMYFVGPEI